MSKLVQLFGTTNPERSGDVVFIHGLNGDVLTTWNFDQSNSWHSWLANDRPDLGLWSVSYAASASNWNGRSMPIVDRAGNLLSLLDGNGIGERPLCFIVHSMGGLIVKQMLRQAITVDRKYRPFAKHIRGIIFLSTPHSGSEVASMIDYFSFFLRPTVSIDELKSNDPFLRDLNSWFSNNFYNNEIELAVFFESRPTKNLLVVAPSSANPGIPGVVPVAIDSDHFSIAKPTDPTEIVYIQSLKTINRAIPRKKDSPFDNLDPFLTSVFRRLIMAQDTDELLILSKEVEHYLDDHRDSIAALQLKAKIDAAIKNEVRPLTTASLSTFRIIKTVANILQVSDHVAKNRVYYLIALFGALLSLIELFVRGFWSELISSLFRLFSK